MFYVCYINGICNFFLLLLRPHIVRFRVAHANRLHTIFVIIIIIIPFFAPRPTTAGYTQVLAVGTLLSRPLRRFFRSGGRLQLARAPPRTRPDPSPIVLRTTRQNSIIIILLLFRGKLQLPLPRHDVCR